MQKQDRLPGYLHRMTGQRSVKKYFYNKQTNYFKSLHFLIAIHGPQKVHFWTV